MPTTHQVPAAVRHDLADWRDERDGAALFDGLAGLDRSARRRRVYARLADAERRHAAEAEARIRAAGVVPPTHRPSWRVRALLAWARVFGAISVLPRVAAMEDADADAYLRRLDREGAVVPHGEERANADALAEFARIESGEAAKRVLLKVRRVVIGLVGASLFAVSVALARNAQIEGLVFGVLTGVVVGPVTHYLLGKLAVPLAAGRLWCGWACWTAALLDQLPFDRGAAWPAGPRRPWRTAHLLAVVVGVAALVLAFGYDRGAVGADAVVWFVIGNLAYWTLGVTLAVRHRDNRAFCKLACPVAVILRTTSRPALLKIAGDPGACAVCASRACNAVCAMGVDVAAMVQAGARVGGGECVACLQCLAVCPPNALAPTLRFDVAGPDRLVVRERSEPGSLRARR
ncbi:MAG: 4Fe-4S binding protein [Trueperaceae bacterium]|nr:4Fe-4S binding protein [Trueperaceae bacterium]